MVLQYFQRDLLRWRRRRDGAVDEAPLRSELFSVEQLDRHAKSLAAWHALERRRGPNRLLPRLDENEEVLLKTYEMVAAAVAQNRRIAPAAEWLIDNFYLIEEQIRLARRHLPRGYSRELPGLANGPSSGFPRVYAIGMELISHVDGRVDAPSLSAFVSAYQSVTALKLGELWAIPIMLRLALIENLRRVASRIAAGRLERDLANQWADRMIEMAEKSPTEVILVLADMARSAPELTSAFVAEFSRRLQGQSPSVGLAIGWVESRLGENGLTIEQMVLAEGQAQAADQLSIGHSIGSLRFLASMDWREFVETMSGVEQALRCDPADVYSDTDFATRDRCRHVVEYLAKYATASEIEIAQAAVSLAREHGDGDHPRDPERHVGYYLLHDGRLRLERKIRARVPFAVRWSRFVHRHPLAIYLGAILAISAGAVYAMLPALSGVFGTPWIFAALIVALVLVASQFAVSLVNWLITVGMEPKALPRMDFSGSIPPEHRTMVVVPTLLSDRAAIDELIDRLEVHYLANRDEHLHFALLSDFTDAEQERMPGDDELLDHAIRAIDILSDKYSDDRGDIFYLFHRPRRWNERERCWMGWERKRGKIAEFNAALRGGSTERFETVRGDVEVFSRIRYIITLDSDTQLPRESAHKLIGSMAHPLNRPRIDERTNRVTHGYSILQPRVSVDLPSAGRSWFARLFSGEPGIDPYTRAVSDVYQDLFAEGSFIGKGIYDLEAFERVLGDRFPRNRILSHDLIEGCYARSGLVSDVELFEQFPSRYLADSSRRHRWIRGDWQIARWLMPSVPGAQDRGESNPLSALSRWKIFDNMRRSLMPIATCALLLGAWTIFPERAIFWSLLILGAHLIPGWLSGFSEAIRKGQEIPWLLHARQVSSVFGRASLQALIELTLLPFNAWLSFDAIARTTFRLVITRRGLLQWRTASEAERQARTSLIGVAVAQWPQFIAVAGAVAIVVFAQADVAATAPFCAAWLFAPLLTWRISRPRRRPEHRLKEREVLFLRSTARKTWRFFETFVGTEDHWLPPDNIQEHPTAAVAHRTSPTNIGLSLLANLSAVDFGYVTVATAIARCEKTILTLENVERYRGHFYNWYDTVTLMPMAPLYISTVDSGNLSAHLLVLRAGLIELSAGGIVSGQIFAGLRDTWAIAHQMAGESLRGDQRSTTQADNVQRLKDLDEAVTAAQRVDTHDLRASHAMLERLLAEATALVASLSPTLDEETRWWLHAFERTCRDHRDDLIALAPWFAAETASELTAAEFAPVLNELEDIDTLDRIAAIERSVLPLLEECAVGNNAEMSRLRASWRERLKKTGDLASQRIRTLVDLAGRCGELADADVGFLYDPSRDLFSIGYNVADHRLDAGFYDLLASEARLASFLAIAQGHVHQDHWFALGRMLTTSGGISALLSWSGSMFEYLMPMLVMPSYENTLLDRTCHAVVRRQIEYGRQRGVPWGISESGYNLTDVNLNYQYRAFGVPGLGLKRGLAEDLVVAPYAAVLALMVAPEAACRNLERFADEGRHGDYGFYEAIDYTASRLPRGAKDVTIRSFMAHHQGMSLLALASVLLGRPMQRRFTADPLFKAADLLLQEKVPKAVAAVFPHAAEVSARRPASEVALDLRVFTNPSSSVPEVHLLSNGRYHVLVSAAGGGSSRWRDLSVTRWREDAIRDSYGLFCYLRDVDSGEWWSNTFQPSLKSAKTYEAIFSQARAEFRRRDHDIDTYTEIAVSPEDDVEVRRVTLTNRSREARTIEISTYGEVVIAPLAADTAHPAFSNLFVQTHLIRQHQAILCTRRARSQGERPPWMLHQVAIVDGAVGDTSFETDRSAFIGRGRSPNDPLALAKSGNLRNSEGPVLDPIVSIRRTLTIGPDQVASFDIVCGMAETREAATHLIEKYHERRLADRVFELAWTHNQVVLRQLNASEADAQLYGRLAGSIVYPTHHRRAHASILARNRRGQSGLWGYGISGDFPIVLLRINDVGKIELVKRLVQAHAYWRMKGLLVDLVIWHEERASYRQSLFDSIMGLITAGSEAQMIDKPGGIFVRRTDQISEEDRILIQTMARVVLTDTGGTLSDQVERRMRPEPTMARMAAFRVRKINGVSDATRPDLIFFNGLGGFTKDGREYVIVLNRDQVTPAPWINVLANPAFGTIVSESGGSYTWLENAHEFRVTPWYNDPVGDASGEAFYLRDEESGQFWSPTPQPVRGNTPYISRHGFGYSVFEHNELGIASEMWVHVAIDAPVKFISFKIANQSGRPRRLSLTGYWELVLGELRHKNAMHVITELDQKSGAILARNAFNNEFPGRIAFFDVSQQLRSITGDRGEFLGRNGSTANPAALGRVRLSGKLGAGLDPCAAIQTPIDLAAGEEREIVFTLGVGRDLEDIQDLYRRFSGAAGARNALEQVWAHWNRTLGAVYVETPDPSLNVLANGWLLYQTLACRMWGRSGYYQSGGAYGFRDQLQDSLALLHADPGQMRKHLLSAASRQFREGDVQHWWHPPSGRGVRTHFSDDYLWLPYVVSSYVAGTHDTGVLDERIHFIDGRLVNPDEEAYFDLPQRSDESATLYEHCVRAINHGLRFGAHGLPLIGCGDWNDGMNKVGEHGRGESVWLAFFLFDVLNRFAEVARRHGDQSFAERCVAQAGQLQAHLESNAWDGEWYRRAYFDNGEPLGSASNPECQIDALPQAWSVIAKAGDPQRSRIAMDAVDRRLVNRGARLIRLFEPPFDSSHLNPGYIKGYLPGVRENGGQYTHGALWTILAFASMGDQKRAWELFSLINPISHGDTPARIATYRVEPYVVAADVYAVSPHTGRGGWTWYTGSAGWMYRLIVESFLGLKRDGETLAIAPCVPPEWPGFTVHYRYFETVYKIAVKMQRGKLGARAKVTVDGEEQSETFIALKNDLREHQVSVELVG